MAKNASELNRKVLQNIRTTKSNAEISPILSGTVAMGEIAVQLGSGDTTDKSEIATGLWTLAADGVTPVRFPSEKRVLDMISSGAVLEVDEIEAAVGLDSDGTLPVEWGKETQYFNKNMTIVSAVTKLDQSLSGVQHELDTTQAGAGLNADGEYVKDNTTTYLKDASSLADADKKLDTAISELSGIVTDLDFTLAVEENKVLDGLWQVDGKVSGTSKNITAVKLGGYEEGTNTKVAATDTLGEALGKLQHEINSMNKSGDAQTGHILTTVSEVSGVVSETKALLTDVVLSGYSKTSDTGAIAATDTLEAALSKLENTVSANAISNTDGSIAVATAATGTNISVIIKAKDPILAKDGGNGVYSTLNLVKITTDLPATVKERYELQGINGAKIGQDIDVPKDSHIVSITYITDSADTHYQNLEYKYIDVNGVEQTEYVNMSSLVLEAEFESGVTVTDGVAHGVVNLQSEKDWNDVSFLTVDGGGFKVNGIKDAITSAITTLDVTDTAVAGQYVSAVNETDGKVAMTRANVSDAVLNGYTKGEKPVSTAIAATDDVKGAIAKLEHQIDDAKAAATTKVVEGTDEGNNMTITSATGADNSVTYTVNLTDVASKAALDAEIAARKAVDGQAGQTYVANTGSSYISGATSLNDADTKLDAIIGTHDDADANYDVTFDSTNTVAKSISDIKKAIDEAKSALTLSSTDDKYINTEVIPADTGTTIGISAVTGSVVTATSSNSALVDSWDAKQNLVHELVDNTREGVNNWHVTKTAAADNNNGVTYDFTNLVVDCGTF